MEKFPMITTIQQHVLQQQEELFPEARGIFSSLISGISLATKAIQAQVRRAGLGDQLGSFGATNVQGEEQQKLDVYANQMLLHCLGRRDAAQRVPLLVGHAESRGALDCFLAFRFRKFRENLHAGLERVRFGLIHNFEPLLVSFAWHSLFAVHASP